MITFVSCFLLLAGSAAHAEEVAPAEAPPVAAPNAVRDAPSATDPRYMRLDGFVEAPVWLRTSPKLSLNGVESRFRVLDSSGLLTVAEVASRLGDEAVLGRRKREITSGVAIGSVGLAVAATMLTLHSIEEINNDPVAEPITALTGVAGFVVGIGSFGAVIQANERPWDYWSPDELRVKLTAWNLSNFGVPPLTEPAAPAAPAAPEALLPPAPAAPEALPTPAPAAPPAG